MEMLFAQKSNFNRLLEDLVEELQVPRSRYEQAQKSYNSLGEWLHRKESSVLSDDPDVYVQGSFQLGTAIKPASDEEDYDIDMVCRLRRDMSENRQVDIKNLVGNEIKSYAKSKGMHRPSNGRRCWTLSYADGAQFHMDILPAIPDLTRRKSLADRGSEIGRLGKTALAITDREHQNYERISHDWRSSNPKGYALWFKDRMGPLFRKRAADHARELRASVEDVPIFLIRTPLQGAIQILKRHRDLMFGDNPDDKPISIIITTLAAHAYSQEETLEEALLSILQNLDRHIELRGDVFWVQNPADPDENFADKWPSHPERKDAFFEWLEKARHDFRNAQAALSTRGAAEILKSSLGSIHVNRALAKRNLLTELRLPDRLVSQLGMALSPSYMRRPRWQHAMEGEVRISNATYTRAGYRPQSFTSGSAALPKGCDLRFEASTTVTGKYKVFWQVVNTGSEAEDANGLRGNFQSGGPTRGGLTREESTQYRGVHTIECFIVKAGKLAARSGQFIVNIE